MTTKTIEGNLITLAENGAFHAIAHGCNAFHTFGAGIALAISETWPQALEADKTQTAYGDEMKLGDFSKATATNTNGNPFYIANLYTQFNPGRITPEGIDSEEARLSYVKDAFEKLGEFLEAQRSLLTLGRPLQLGIPLIGAGLAGGDWGKILPLVEGSLSKVEGDLIVVLFKP